MRATRDLTRLRSLLHARTGRHLGGARTSLVHSRHLGEAQTSLVHSRGGEPDAQDANGREIQTVSKDSEVNPATPINLEDLVEPTTCCMSGCVNCVWIQYAQNLSEVLKSSDKDVQAIIMEKVQDPNMRAFLSMELRARNLIK